MTSTHRSDESAREQRGDLTRWNNSALTLLQECGEAFRRRYIEGERPGETLRMIRGTVVHRVAHIALRRKWRDGALPGQAEARDLAADQFDAVIRRGNIRFEPDDLAVGAAKSQGRAKDFAIGLAGFHVQDVAPSINPVAVERKIEVKPRDTDITIHGTIDLIDGRGNGEWIRDLKTAEKSPASGAAEESQQLTMYAMLRWAEKQRLPERLALDYMIRTPAGTERYLPLLTTRTAADVQSLVNRINTAVEAVKRGSFVPANQNYWKCDPRYCEFFSSCPYVRRTKRPTS